MPVSDFTVYLAARGYTAELVRELGLPEDPPADRPDRAPALLAEQGGVFRESDPSAPPPAWLAALPTEDDAPAWDRDRLVFRPGPPVPAAWAANVWREPFFLEVASIGEAARALKSIQRNWALYPTRLRRRSALIQEKLPPVSARPLAFGAEPPSAPLGSWTLVDQNLLLASADCSSPWPHGEVQFVEDKTTPPTRAYLKLWEAFTRLGRKPAPGELCLDLGSSPGGWTWVLQTLGARVVSVDKADLAPAVARLPNVEFLRESAFGLDPRQFKERYGVADWLFSDVICYPERLLGLVERWLEAGACRHLVCTVKFQAATDFASQAAFAAIPDSRLLHLHHNKHELTWALLR